MHSPLDAARARTECYRVGVKRIFPAPFGWFAAASALAVALAMMTASGVASAHVVLTKPVPRDANPHKNGPCGGLPRGNNPTVYNAGDPISINWDETIDHTGCFVLDISMTGDDQNFTPLATIQDPVNAVPKTYTSTVTLPNVSCAQCTFRLRQLMGADPATCGPNTVPTDGTYYACADIQINATSTSSSDAGTVVVDAGAGTTVDSGTGTIGSSGGTDGGLVGTTDAGIRGASDDTSFADTSTCNVSRAGFGRTSARPLGTAFSLACALTPLALAIRRRRRASRSSAGHH